MLFSRAIISFSFPIIHTFSIDFVIHVISRARKAAGVLSQSSKTFLELDIWLPELQLAFEYQVSLKIKDI